MQKKRCSKCGELKTLDGFYKNKSRKDGHGYWCKECMRKHNREWYRSETGQETSKKYRQSEKHKAALVRYSKTEKGKKTNREKSKRHRQSEKFKETQKRYSQTEKGKRTRRQYKQSENGKESSRRYNQSEKRKEARRRYNQKIQVRIAMNLRTRTRLALIGTSKSISTMKLLGCTIDVFLMHLESQFQSGMTFDNYGLWELDHINPCSAFDLTDPKQQKECFHYTNLQPLWREDNLKKSNKVA